MAPAASSPPVQVRLRLAPSVPSATRRKTASVQAFPAHAPWSTSVQPVGVLTVLVPSLLTTAMRRSPTEPAKMLIVIDVAPPVATAVLLPTKPGVVAAPLSKRFCQALSPVLLVIVGVQTVWAGPLTTVARTTPLGSE